MNVARWLSQHVDICPGLWLVADLFTQLCSLSPDPRPDSSSCAEAAGVGGQGCSQMHFGGWRGGGAGFHHTLIQVLLTRLEPIWERGEVLQRVGPAATRSLSL